jgi:hypothetical protein
MMERFPIIVPVSSAVGMLPSLWLWPVRLRDDFQQMAAGIVKIYPTSAVQMVDLAGTGQVEIRVEFDTHFADPLERRIKLRLTNQERVMLWAEVAGIGEIQRDAIAGDHRQEMRPLPSDFQAQDTSKKTGRLFFVACGDNEVI